MATWIQTDNLHQNGEPVTRRIRTDQLSDDIWFTTNGYAEIADDNVADILATEIGSISKVAEPADPGTYYGDASESATIRIVLEDGNFDALTAETGNIDVFDTERLYTRSRAPTAVIRDDGGTCRADGPNGEISSGPDAGAVIQAVHDAQDRPFIWIAEDVSFTSAVTITKHDTWIKSSGKRVLGDASFETFFQIGTTEAGGYANRTQIDGIYFAGRNNVDFAARFVASHTGRFRDNFARDCNVAMVDMIGGDAGENNTHHFILGGLHSTSCPIGIQMADATSVVADGTVRDCYFSGVTEAGIVAENPMQCVFDHVKTSASTAIDASVKITQTGSTGARVEGNKLENIHVENNVASPGAAVMLETTSGSSSLSIHTIRDPSAAGGGPVVRMTGPADGGNIQSVSISGTRSSNPDGTPLWEVGDVCQWVRIDSPNVIGGRDNLDDNGFATVFNGVGSKAEGNLGLPASQWQRGDTVHNDSDGAVYRKQMDGSWTQLEPADPQNLAGQTGAFDGQEAIDDGTNTAGNGLLCRWDGTGSQWVASDGTVFS